MKTTLRIDGTMILIVSVAGLGLFLYAKRNAIKQAAQKVNPASDQNYIYDGIGGNDPDSDFVASSDRFFGAIDLINPFNDDDTYARRVWGLDK